VGLRGLVDDHVHRQGGEVGEHDLHHRPAAEERRSDRSPDNRLLGDRRVEHALRAEAPMEALRDTEHAPGLADVLADQEDLLVALHLLGERLGDRGGVRDRPHRSAIPS
jgi:hypothetical protein